MLMPVKKSLNWIYILVGIFIINLVALIMSRFILDVTLDVRMIIGFIILSAIICILASIGYFGFWIFSSTFIIFNCFGIVYMYSIILTDSTDGWADLASVVGFTVLVGIGIVAGIITEFVYRMVKHNKV